MGMEQSPGNDGSQTPPAEPNVITRVRRARTGAAKPRAAEAAAATAAAGPPAAAQAASAAGADEQAWRRRMRDHAVPDAVAARFIRLGNKFYFPDKTLAFRDAGAKLKAETDNLEVIRSLLAIAEARGWQALAVTGSPAFRREVWREASLRGIDARGYEATELEREALRQTLHRRGHEPGQNASLRQEGAGAAQHDAQTVGAGATSGVLLEAAAAPYRFDASQPQSFYVKLHTDHGERTLWGVGLESALAESRTRIKPGDRVIVAKQGSEPVTMKIQVRGRDGGHGEQVVNTHRNSWTVEREADVALRAERAAAFRNGDLAQRELIARYPELTNAIATMRLGRLFAEKMVDRPEDCERLVASLRDTLARAIEQGHTIAAPRVREAAARKLDRTAAEIDELTRHAASSKTANAARAIGARARAHEDMQHARA